ncbi:sugar phosphate isomerase/epimerase family protein [Oceanobacillus timonensis]|uniref:sugar phosphate isomerase/epimerase family protein n=1 Tax=Oceanobacillus timonensis TaxID=1926285 RepID=UPI0009BC0F65|nr:sugar phosphate isomerase/epimerase family protein [Oceanobacillus timonensis]
MQKCIVVGEETKFGPIPIKGDLNDTLPYVSKLGYKYIELNLRSPFTLSMQELKNLLSDNDLKVAALSSGYPYFHENVSFTSKDSIQRKKAIHRINEYINLASLLETQVIIGSIRGTAVEEGDYEVFIDSLQQCLWHAEKMGVVLALEPINRYEMNLVNTVDDGLKIIHLLNSDNLKLILDTFHMNIEEKSIYDAISTAGDAISHFHVADSNRKPMGCGHLDFTRILEVLTSTGYNGALSAELLPLSDQEETVKLISAFFEGEGF